MKCQAEGRIKEVLVQYLTDTIIEVEKAVTPTDLYMVLDVAARSLQQVAWQMEDQLVKRPFFDALKECLARAAETV